MRLTTKGRYAVTAMLDLALHGTERPVSLADISGRQDISLSYLEQLFAKLRRNELVSSVRGPGGGYRLSRSGTDIYVAQIIDEAIKRRAGGAAHAAGEPPPLRAEALGEVSFNRAESLFALESRAVSFCDEPSDAVVPCLVGLSLVGLHAGTLANRE